MVVTLTGSCRLSGRAPHDWELLLCKGVPRRPTDCQGLTVTRSAGRGSRTHPHTSLEQQDDGKYSDVKEQYLRHVKDLFQKD